MSIVGKSQSGRACAEPASRPSAPRSGGGAKRRALTSVSTRARCWLDDAAGDHNILRSTRVQFLSVPRARQHPWELLAAIDAGRVDLRVEPGRNLAGRRQEPEEGSEVGHHMLEGRTRQAGGDGTQKGVEIPAVECGEPRRVRLVVHMCQKLPSRAAVVPHGRRREPPDLLQIAPVGGDSLLDPGQRGRRIQRQLGLAIPRHLPHQDRQIGILLGIGGSTGPQSRPRQARQGLHAALLQTAD